MPTNVCHGCWEIQSASIRQLETRPERMASLAVKAKCAVLERRCQYISAKLGRSCQMRKAATTIEITRAGTPRVRRTRLRWIQPRTDRPTRMFSNDARE